MNPLVARRSIVVTVVAVALFAVYLLGTTGRAGAAASTVGSPPAVANSSSEGPGITVTGRASVAGISDTLRLDLSVVTTAASVTEALAAANRTTSAVQKSLLGNGVAKKDLQTAGLSIQPSYDYTKSGTPRLTGYQVSQSLRAQLRELVRAGAAIGGAVSAGGNAVRVNGISLDLQDTGTLVSTARDKAFADARTKAEQYAKAARRTLGAAVSITEDVGAVVPIPMPMENALTSGRTSVPIQPGSQDVSVNVTVVFAMT